MNDRREQNGCHGRKVNILIAIFRKTISNRNQNAVPKFSLFGGLKNTKAIDFSAVVTLFLFMTVPSTVNYLD